MAQNYYKLDFILFQFIIILAMNYKYCVPHTLQQQKYLLNDFDKTYLNKFNHINFHHHNHHNRENTVIISKDLTPAELMVDLTNDLCYRIIHLHSMLNRNNFAFSPTALMSVLVALYEGSTGRSALQVKNNLLLPTNHDIIRIGYRDIHRRLRTYFFVMDNPLKGLSLNKENITIKRSYENLLKFYGFDLSMDMVTSTPMEILNQTKNVITLNVQSRTETYIDNKTERNTIQTMSTTLTSTTTVPYNETSTTMATSAVADITKTGTETETETTTENIKSTTIKTTTSASSVPKATTIVNTPETGTKEEASELVDSSVNAEINSNINSEPFARLQKARTTRLPINKLQAPLINENIPTISYLPAKTNNRYKQYVSRTRRSKRHLLDLKNILLHEYEEHEYNLPSTFDTLDVDPNFISSITIKQNYNTDIITHVFYLDSEQTIYTTFKVYNAVLYYKYFSYLHLTVIEMELDTNEYNLVIVLPEFLTDMTTAAASLRLAPKLRYLRKQLKPKWVQAIIPDFKLHGAIFLTNDLQNMGINDVFEPNHADFRPMAPDKGVYVKHIEQSINVHIRTHPIRQLRRTSGQQIQPLQISVNHPFIFFIVDRDLDIAVMAGRILNPLNVRIQ